MATPMPINNKERFRITKMRERCNQIMDSLDLDHNGNLDEDEFIVWVRKGLKQTKAERIEEQKKHGLTEKIQNLMFSIASRAKRRPLIMWSLSSAFFNKKVVLLLIVSILKSRNTSSIFLRERVVGSPLTRAKIFALKLF